MFEASTSVSEVVLDVEFVQFMPDELAERTLYVSMEYSTAVHLCCCGCRNKVVTPLSPTQWELTFDRTVTLFPSIGNWEFPCQSHYWIKRNRVEWVPLWTKEQIAKGRVREGAARENYLGRVSDADDPQEPVFEDKRQDWWARLISWLRRRD